MAAQRLPSHIDNAFLSLLYMANCNGILTSLHAFKRMLERSISDTDVEDVIAKGETIKEYPEDKP